MDPDFPARSVEYDDLPPVSSASKFSDIHNNAPRHMTRISMDGAAAIPLPPSSPLKSPRKTPKAIRHAVSSPSNKMSSSHTNHDRQSTPPSLLNRRSSSNITSARGTSPANNPGFRRTSSGLSPSVTMKQVSPTVEPKRPLSAASVAQEYFRRELKHQETAIADNETVVFVHDSCYGHRFARPRTSKAALGTIVERPERMQATILGASAAYVRLGDRHAQGRYGPHPDRDPSKCLPPPFKIRKTFRSVALNHPAVTHVHGAKWMEELQIMCDSAAGKLAMNGKELVRPIGYGKDENGATLPRLHEGDLYLCSESLNALQGCLGGVCDAVDSVFSPDSTKRAFVCIRPPGHHCSSNFPSGFCWLNNVHVGVGYGAMNHGLTHAAIIDFDLHHGDGSQSIAWDHNHRSTTLQKNAAAERKTPIGYFSLHDINSYPCEWGDEEKVRNASLCIENAHGQSIWNVHLEPWKNKDEFWQLYETRYCVLLEKTRLFLRHHTSRMNATPNGKQAKAAIFISAGFDASEWEGEGMQRHKVNVPTEFYARFTADVVKLAQEQDLGVAGRVISVLEGGYSDRALMSGAFSHICGLSTQNLKDSTVKVESTASPQMELNEPLQTLFYDPSWWEAQQLEMVEARVLASNASHLPLKSVEKVPGNYTSPTEASTAKMTEHARERRSLSAQFESRMILEPKPEPEQPPPDVDWATAAYELSRLIIPSDRQTLSCRHEELNAEATRIRRERQSGIGLPVVEPDKMQLRDRKTRKSSPFETGPVQPPSRGDKRRTTIAAAGDLPDPKFGAADGDIKTNGRPRRRSSTASNIISALQDMRLGSAEAPVNTDAAEHNRSRAPSQEILNPPKPETVRKSRLASVTKGLSKPRSTPRKAAPSAPPVPRVPSGVLPRSQGRGSTEEATMEQRSSSQARSGSANSVVKADYLDGLASGMKKMSIKLKVKSPDDMATQGAADVENVKKPRAPRKTTVPKATPKTSSLDRNKTSSTRDIISGDTSGTPTQIAGRPSLEQESAALATTVSAAEAPTTITTAVQAPIVAAYNLAAQAFAPNMAEQSVSLMESAFPGAGTSATRNQPSAIQTPLLDLTQVPGPKQVVDTTEATQEDASLMPHFLKDDENVPSEVPDSPAGNAVLGRNQVKENHVTSASLPNTSRKTKVDLPVFTSSSSIPFANSNMASTDAGDKEKERESVTLPGISDEDVERGGVYGPGNHHGDAARENGENGAAEAEKGKIQTNELSIWDIPETPQKH